MHAPCHLTLIASLTWLCCILRVPVGGSNPGKYTFQTQLSIWFIGFYVVQQIKQNKVIQQYPQLCTSHWAPFKLLSEPHPDIATQLNWIGREKIDQRSSEEGPGNSEWALGTHRCNNLLTGKLLDVHSKNRRNSILWFSTHHEKDMTSCERMYSGERRQNFNFVVYFKPWLLAKRWAPNLHNNTPITWNGGGSIMLGVIVLLSVNNKLWEKKVRGAARKCFVWLTKRNRMATASILVCSVIFTYSIKYICLDHSIEGNRMDLK